MSLCSSGDQSRRSDVLREAYYADRDLILSPSLFFQQSGYRRRKLVNGFWFAQESLNSRAPSFLLAIVSRKHDDRSIAAVCHALRTEYQLQPVEARQIVVNNDRVVGSAAL